MLEVQTWIKHASIDIEEFQSKNKFPSGYDSFATESGENLSPESVMAYITLQKAQGHNMIPLNAECGNPCRERGCAGFDYKKCGCPGHEE